jgi:polyphosphate kinase
MIELLARFDERRNISLITKLKSAGVNIVYSLEQMKTHCKMCLVVKATKKGLKTYAHMGTGNYNENTSRIYTDISYFTTRPSIGRDLNAIFNMITGVSTPENLKAVSYSPITLMDTLVSEMERIANAQDEIKEIYIKVNAISDREIVQKILDLADSHKDLKFKIICRGICSLPSRDNVEIKSIVGRFLEHSRIYIFRNGNYWKVFISSADLLTRNLKNRIELLIEISKHKEKIINIFNEYWKDTANSYQLLNNEWVKNSIKESYINTQNNMVQDRD